MRRHWWGGIIATATVEGHATTLIVSTATTVAFVESVFTAAIVSATTAADWLSLLALVLLLATLAVVLNVPDWFTVGIVACLQGAGCQVHSKAFGFAPAWH